jgi:hypothetical protein
LFFILFLFVCFDLKLHRWVVWIFLGSWITSGLCALYSVSGHSTPSNISHCKWWSFRFTLQIFKIQSQSTNQCRRCKYKNLISLSLNIHIYTTC